MKQRLEISGVDVYFSNSGDGFDISFTNDDSDIYLPLRPEDLALFAEAVVAYSWNNGLTEVPTDHLKKYYESLALALKKVNKEILYREVYK